MVVENKIIWVRHISFIGNFILFCRFLCCPFTLYRIDSVLNTCGFISVFRRKIGLQIRHLVVKLHTQHQQNRITSQWYVREESQNLLGEPSKKKLPNFGHCPKLRGPPPPPLTVVWTFWHKKFEITKSIFDKSKIGIFLIGPGLVCVHMFWSM